MCEDFNTLFFQIRSMLHVLQEVYTCVQVIHTDTHTHSCACACHVTVKFLLSAASIKLFVCAFQENNDDSIAPRRFPEISRVIQVFICIKVQEFFFVFFLSIH